MGSEFVGYGQNSHYMPSLGRDGAQAVYALPDSVEGHTTTALRESLKQTLARGEMEITFDFSSVKDMDLSGVALFLSLGRTLREWGRGKPIIAHGRKDLIEFFEKTGMTEYFNVLEPQEV